MINFRFKNIVNTLNQVADTITVYRHAKLNLGSNFIPFGHCDFAHIVTKAGDFQILHLIPSGSGPSPDGNIFNHIRILPVANNHLAIDPHSGHDETVFPVAMSRLIQVHEIHIDLPPWQIAVKLCVQVKDWFLEFF